MPRALLLTGILLCTLPGGLAAAETAKPAAPADQAAPPLPADFWIRFADDWPRMLHRLDMADPKMVDAIAKIQAQYPGATIHAEVAVKELSRITFPCAGMDGEGTFVPEATGRGWTMAIKSNQYEVPKEVVSSLSFDCLDSVEINDPLRDPVDCVVDNMPMHDLVAKICDEAQIDYVTRRDIGKDLLVSMHLTQQTRIKILQEASAACGWYCEVMPRIEQSSDVIDGNFEQHPGGWEYDLIEDLCNDEVRKSGQADPLGLVEKGLARLRLHQHQRIVSILPVAVPAK